MAQNRWRTEAHIQTFRWSSGRRMWVPKTHAVVPNLITTIGDRWNADKVVAAAGGTPANPIDDPLGMILGTNSTAPSKSDTWVLTPAAPTSGQGGVGSEFQAFSSVVDDEANSRVTWASSWTAAQSAVDDPITEVAIVKSAVSTPAHAVARFVFAGVDKSADDTPLNIIVHWNAIP